MSDLERVIADAGKFLQSELDLSVEQTTLQIYSFDEWQIFIDKYNFDKNAQGVYMPKSLSANVLEDTKLLLPNIFHEYYGHGLFCERSHLGKQLVEILRQDHSYVDFMYEPVDKNMQKYGICGMNIGNYEGFAVWLESIICCETGNVSIWEKKKKAMTSDYLELYDHFSKAEKLLSRKGLIEQMGF